MQGSIKAAQSAAMAAQTSADSAVAVEGSIVCRYRPQLSQLYQRS
jgi:hypothetical protein